MGFSATIERRERDSYVVALDGDLELREAGRLKKLLFELIADGAEMIEIDLRRVTLLDATAAGVLIIAERAFSGDAERFASVVGAETSSGDSLR